MKWIAMALAAAALTTLSACTCCGTCKGDPSACTSKTCPKDCTKPCCAAKKQ
jgi:hypothetical protein